MSTPGIIEAPLTETAAPATAPAPTAHKAGQEAPANWSGIASLALGVFSLVTAEFLPASLLTAIASDLHVSDGAAGQAVTATAIVGAVAAPSIPLLTRNIDRKRVVLMLSLLLLVSNILAVTAPNLPVLLVGAWC